MSIVNLVNPGDIGLNCLESLRVLAVQLAVQMVQFRRVLALVIAKSIEEFC